MMLTCNWLFYHYIIYKECPSGTTHEGGYCFKLDFSAKKTQDDAKTYCEGLGLIQAELDTSAKLTAAQTFVSGLCKLVFCIFIFLFLNFQAQHFP